MERTAKDFTREHQLEILTTILQWKESDNIEMLTYTGGACIEALVEMGCPLDLDKLTKIVDEWANKKA